MQFRKLQKGFHDELTVGTSHLGVSSAPLPWQLCVPRPCSIQGKLIKGPYFIRPSQMETSTGLAKKYSVVCL